MKPPRVTVRKMRDMRIGLIGAGSIGARHFRTLGGFDDAAVVAVADTQLERAEALAVGSRARAYGDYREMLEREDLDALYICVPPFAHGGPETAALERGLPFFVEKPLSVDFESAEHMAQRVEAQGLVTAVGYHWRYLDITERACALVSRNPARLALGYWLDLTPPAAWWVDETMSGGQIVEQTTHIFDLARLLVGEVTSVYAVGSRIDRAAFPTANVDDVSTVTLTFASGAVGTISSTCLLEWQHRVGLHLFCAGMALELSERELTVDAEGAQEVQRAKGDPFVGESRDFLDAVQGKANRIRVPYAEALKTHRLVTAAARSAWQGRVVEVPLDRAQTLKPAA